MKKHDWRAIMQFSLTDDEARKAVVGYGHPEVDYAPDTALFAGEKPPVGDPRVFFGLHNLLRDQTIIVCWKCEEAWTPEVASRECEEEGMFADGRSLTNRPITNVPPDIVLTGISRNDPCPCGSGLKFKRCHGA